MAKMRELITTITILILSSLIFYKGYRSLEVKDVSRIVSSIDPENNTAESDSVSKNFSKEHPVSSKLSKAVAVHHLGCWNGKNQYLKTDAESIRFSLQLCNPKTFPLMSNMNSKIFVGNNEAGKEVISVMDKNTRTIASEFFPLQSGENPVIISLWEKEKKIWQTLVVISR